MSPIAPKPQNMSPEAALLQRTRPADRNSAPSKAKGSAANDDQQSDESNFSKVLETKSAPVRSNDSSVDNKNLSSDQKIATKSEPQPNSELGVKSPSQKSPQMVISPTEDKTEQVSREAAMEVFLVRMQNELGVSPEQILQSFAQLDVTDLTAPPEQTLEKVIGQLKLPPAKEKQAEDMYAEMLALSATANMSEYLKNQNQTATLKVLSPKEAAEKELQKNIGAMSDSFFAKPQIQPQSLDGLKKAQGTQAYGKASDKDRMAMLGIGAAGGTAAALAAQDATTAQVANAGVEGFALPDDVENLSIDQQRDILAGLKTELAKLDAMVPQQGAGPEAAPPDASAKSLADGAANAAQASAPHASALTAMGIAGKAHSQNTGADKDSDKKDQLGQDQAITIDPKQQQVDKAHVKGQFAVETPKAAKSDAQNNIQDIISQAQFLAKKGGGEMKVKMSPEGMGDVHLKVIVEKGQVNVEMVASNTEAKKLLERGIDELKANLVGHKLHVDQIKVGGSAEASGQMQNQHQQDDGQRNFQHRFLQDFQDQNSAFRREIFDIGPARKPGSQILDEASNAKYNPSAKKKPANRRLDLVA